MPQSRNAPGVVPHVTARGMEQPRSAGVGFRSHRYRAAKVAPCRGLLGGPAAPAPPPPQDWTTRYEALPGEPVDRCPACRQDQMRRVEALPPLASLAAPRPPGLDSS